MSAELLVADPHVCDLGGGVVLAFLLEFQAHEILEVFVIVKVPMNYNI